MSKIIGVQFQKNGKMYYFDANGIEVQNNTYVIVDTVRGLDLGEVVLSPREMPALQETESLKKVCVPVFRTSQGNAPNQET